MRITDGALAAAATLSDAYLPDRQLPDKAIDLIDEAAAKVSRRWWRCNTSILCCLGDQQTMAKGGNLFGGAQAQRNDTAVGRQHMRVRLFPTGCRSRRTLC